MQTKQTSKQLCQNKPVCKKRRQMALNCLDYFSMTFQSNVITSNQL